MDPTRRAGSVIELANSGVGALVTLDSALLVTPPKCMNVGYVPIVYASISTVKSES